MNKKTSGTTCQNIFCFVCASKHSEMAAPAPADDEVSTVCELCDVKHVATWHCKDCGQSMCTVLAKVHPKIKAFNDHQLKKLAEEEHEQVIPGDMQPAIDKNELDGKYDVPPQPLCQTHQNVLEVFDENCDKLICAGCIASKAHGQCKLSPISEAGPRVLVERRIEKTLGQVADRLKIIGGLNQDVSNAVTQLHRDADHWKSKIEASRIEVCRLIEFLSFGDD
jgi:transcription elongation factor Elf1